MPSDVDQIVAVSSDADGRKTRARADGHSTAHTYDPLYFAPLAAIEERHFWFRARSKVISRVVAHLVRSLPPGHRVLEVGCGTGHVLRTVERVCPGTTVLGMDLFGEGLRVAQHRTSVPLVQGDVHLHPFNQPFDLIGCFDVIEHLDDDERVLRSLHTLLTPGGALCLTVPAHMSLWSYFDKGSRHRRRYSLNHLSSLLESAGYRVEFVTQYMASLFLPLWLGRRLATWMSSGQADSVKDLRGTNLDLDDSLTLQELRIVPLVNQAVYATLRWEQSLIGRGISLPLGTSLLAIARRPQNERQLD